MFISTHRSGYDNDGQARISGRFLLLVQPEGTDGHKAPIRALVRFTAMEQVGQFMMGKCRAFNHQIILSGSYGSDGLPCSVPKAVYDRATPVPPDLVEAWNKGGGHNGAGSEADDMRHWAKATFLQDRS